MDKIVYEAQPELETETYYVCIKCPAMCFDLDFANSWGCATHGWTMRRVVRQFQNGVMVSEFKERL